MFKYSASNNAFYLPGVNKDIPKDAVNVSKATHKNLMGLQAAGKKIVPGPDGEPMTVDQAAKDPWLLLRHERDARLSASIWLLERHLSQREAGVDTDLPPEQFVMWCLYWQALRDMPETTIDPTNPIWPEEPSI